MPLPLNTFAKLFQNGELVDANQDLNPWVASHNAIITELNNLGSGVSSLTTQSQALTITARPNSLTVDAIGGTLRNSTGTIFSVPSTALVIPANATRFVWVDDGGNWQQGAAYPVMGWRVARITSSPTSVTAVQNEPARVISSAIDYDRRVLVARKGTSQVITGGTPVILNGWTTVTNEVGAAWNAAGGVWTLAENTAFRAEVDVRIINTQANASLTAKLSLYSGPDELKILDEFSSFADSNGAIWKLGGWFTTPKGGPLGAGSQITARVQLRAGTTGTIAADQNTELTIYRY